MLEFSPENRALKSRSNPQMKSRSHVLRAIAGVALINILLDHFWDSKKALALAR